MIINFYKVHCLVIAYDIFSNRNSLTEIKLWMTKFYCFKFQKNKISLQGVDFKGFKVLIDKNKLNIMLKVWLIQTKYSIKNFYGLPFS